MQIFEFHFNPPHQSKRGAGQAPDLIFDSFCYDPENIYEKKLGGLYLAGSLKNALPQNIHFLNNLAQKVKEKYYKLSAGNPEKALKQSLKEANSFLEEIAKKGDVSWLGNLSFVCLSLKKFELNFTKTGEIKIYLLRSGRVVDIEGKIKFQDIEPYPLKIFGNIVSGKLAENDAILILTQKISEAFQRLNLIDKIAQVFPAGTRGIKEILNGKGEELSKVTGLCLLIFLSREGAGIKKEIIPTKQSFKKFSLKEILIGLKFPQLRFPNLKIKNSLKLIGFLSLVLSLGFFVSGMENKRKTENFQKNLNQIQEKVNEADNYLILKETNSELKNKADSLLKESWNNLSVFLKVPTILPREIRDKSFSLQNKIFQTLSALYKLENIESPELFFEVGLRDFVPQKIIAAPEDIYLFRPYSQNLYAINQKKEGKIVPFTKKIDSAINLSETILLFSKPRNLAILKNGNVSEEIFLEESTFDFNSSEMSSYAGNLYSLDKNSGEIIKYPRLGDLKWGGSEKWSVSQTKKTIGAKSMAVSGSIWLLTRENLINRYYASQLQETLNIDIFPEPKNFFKILAPSPLAYLYILEPEENRIIIIEKSGKIVKQFQSKKFDNLLDFSVSENGKTIYLLNGQKVFILNLP